MSIHPSIADSKYHLIYVTFQLEGSPVKYAKSF